jgi:hypothetical protein
MEQKFEFRNVCPHCGAENTIWPVWRARKRFYVCDDEVSGGCGKPTRGITKTEWAKRTGRMTPGDETKVKELMVKVGLVEVGRK